jgi:hypothetical protein
MDILAAIKRAKKKTRKATNQVAAPAEWSAFGCKCPGTFHCAKWSA